MIFILFLQYNFLYKKFSLMEENLTLKLCDLKLKKFIEKSIHKKELAQCSTFMSRKKLDLFYEQMHDHLYRQNLSKIKRQRRFSLGNEQIMDLEDKQSVKMATQPEYTRQKHPTKPKVQNEKFRLQSVNFSIKDTFQPQKAPQPPGIQGEINYYVRRVKNPKVIRYITLKPQKQQPKIPQLFKKARRESTTKNHKICGNTNYQQRKILLNDLKKAKRYRNSCIQL